MKVKLDAQGYIEQYVLVGENPDCTIEVIEPDDFDICHYKAYRIVGEQCILDIRVPISVSPSSSFPSALLS